MPNSERKKTQTTESLINTKPRFCLILPEQEAPAAARALSFKRALSDATTASCGVVSGHTARSPSLAWDSTGGSPGDTQQTPDALNGFRAHWRAHLPGAWHLMHSPDISIYLSPVAVTSSD